MGTMLVLGGFDQTRYHRAGYHCDYDGFCYYYYNTIEYKIQKELQRSFERREHCSQQRWPDFAKTYNRSVLFFFTSFRDIFQRTKGSLLTYP